MKSFFSILVIFLVAVLPFSANAFNSTTELRYEFAKKQISLYLAQGTGLTLVPNTIDIQTDNNILNSLMRDVANAIGLVTAGEVRSAAGYVVYFQVTTSDGARYNSNAILTEVSSALYRILPEADYCSQTIVTEDSPYYCMYLNRHIISFEPAE